MNASKTDVAPIGLLGGTFDPIHVGHLRLAEEAREALQLARVSFIPAGDPPHRGAPLAPATHRLEMVRRAIADNPAFSIDDSETRSIGKSYTVLTLERLRTRLGSDQPLVLILGADAFQSLPSWHRWRELLELAHIAVANRPGAATHGRDWPSELPAELDEACRSRIHSDPSSLRQAAAGWIVPFDMTALAISASMVRELIRGGRSARYLLPDSVLDYIGLQYLYR